MATSKHRAAQTKQSGAATARRSSARRRPVSADGPVQRLGEVALRELDRFGLRDVVELALNGAAAGVVAAGYGRDALRVQLRVSTAVWRALAVARGRILSSGVSRAEILDLLDLLVDRVLDAIADLMRRAQLPTSADLDLICERLDRIGARMAALERSRRARSEPAGAPSLPRLSLQSREARSAAGPSGEAAAAEGPGHGTMVIGSAPEPEAIEAPRERASSMSAEPDALSHYLSKRPNAAGEPAQEEPTLGPTPRRQDPR